MRILPALKTLFLPIKQNQIEISSKQEVLFLNAQFHPALQNLNADLYQPFKPFSETINASQTIPDRENAYDVALILGTKNQIETEYFIASALRALKPHGILIIAADNKSGGTRLIKTLKKFDLENIQSESKHKARVCWTTKGNIDEKAIKAALEKGQIQIQNNFQTQPGIYGWNKTDKGSELLTAHLPENLSGNGADFGCGYGYLALHAIETCPKIKSLTCIDADARALECAKLNLKDFTSTSYLWEDLTRPLPTLKNLDFVLMNPPFHEGKKTDISIGQSFIQNAHKSLRPGSTLYMVANAHLPYEETLNTLFSDIKKPTEKAGFKIFIATK